MPQYLESKAISLGTFSYKIDPEAVLISSLAVAQAGRSGPIFARDMTKKSILLKILKEHHPDPRISSRIRMGIKNYPRTFIFRSKIDIY